MEKDASFNNIFNFQLQSKIMIIFPILFDFNTHQVSIL